MTIRALTILEGIHYMLVESLRAGLPASEIIHRLYHEEDIRLFECQPVQFHCGCTRERVANAQRLLGYNEIQSILKECGAIDVDCEFCNQHYTIDKVDAESCRPA